MSNVRRNKIRNLLQRKHVAEETYKAVEGMYDGNPVTQIDISKWGDKIKNRFLRDAKLLAEEKNISFDDAASVILNASFKLYFKHLKDEGII